MSTAEKGWPARGDEPGGPMDRRGGRGSADRQRRGDDGESPYSHWSRRVQKGSSADFAGFASRDCPGRPGMTRCQPCDSLSACSRRGLALSTRAGAAARQGHLRHQLGGRGRARRLLPGAGRRHLPQVRARRDHPAGRAEREPPPAAAGRPHRLLHERQHAAGVRRRRAQNIPTLVVAAMFQKDPQVLLAHPGPGHREVRRPEEADAVRLQGGHGVLLPMDEAASSASARSR